MTIGVYGRLPEFAADGSGAPECRIKGQLQSLVFIFSLIGSGLLVAIGHLCEAIYFRPPRGAGVWGRSPHPHAEAKSHSRSLSMPPT
jgi:hypothetical protein